MSTLQEWYEKNGFNKDGYTYIITGDSYSIKEDLKKHNFKFNKILLWHNSEPSDYEEQVIQIHFNDVASQAEWGEVFWKQNAKQFIEERLAEACPVSNSEWVYEPGDRIRNIYVTLVGYGMTAFGYFYKFTTVDGNTLIWLTSKHYQNVTINSNIILTGTVKKHEIYKREKVTILSRCILREADV